MPEDDPVVAFPSADAWRSWLASSHSSSAGVWLKLARAGSGIESVTYDEALDVALCFGWIDARKQSFDESWWLQRFTPRASSSKWSKRNCGKAEALIASGAMEAAGLREVERARADGRWDAAYAGSATAVVPDDLRAALDASPAAASAFATLDSRNRYAILYRVADAKRPETRARRIGKFVAMLAAGERLHP